MASPKRTVPITDEHTALLLDHLAMKMRLTPEQAVKRMLVYINDNYDRIRSSL